MTHSGCCSKNDLRYFRHLLSYHLCDADPLLLSSDPLCSSQKRPFARVEQPGYEQGLAKTFRLPEALYDRLGKIFLLLLLLLFIVLLPFYCIKEKDHVKHGLSESNLHLVLY